MQREYLEECSFILTKLLLFRQKQQKVEENKEIWSLLFFCDIEGEISLLLDEEDVNLFPANALLVCPQRWKAVKLCGRTFDFNETGVVSAMSRVDPSVPILNISTFMTNCTLVEIHQVETTLDTLSDVLEVPVMDV